MKWIQYLLDLGVDEHEERRFRKFESCRWSRTCFSDARSYPRWSSQFHSEGHYIWRPMMTNHSDVLNERWSRGNNRWGDFYRRCGDGYMTNTEWLIENTRRRTNVMDRAFDFRWKDRYNIQGRYGSYRVEYTTWLNENYRNGRYRSNATWLYHWYRHQVYGSHKIDDLNWCKSYGNPCVVLEAMFKCISQGMEDTVASSLRILSQEKDHPCAVLVADIRSSMADKSFDVLHPFPERPLAINSRRKLLILDLNGLLADLVSSPPKGCKPDTRILKRSIFKRPFCLDFLNFCFERFHVGIWSSRTKKILDVVVNYLLGSLKTKLVLCWDLSHCTPTKFKSLENKHKGIVFKELNKIWLHDDPHLPWKQGEYNPSNTLLLDDSPYKALLNPMHSAIFPRSYSFKDTDDNSLGPEGDLRVYLEKLAKVDDVQRYVEQNPLGQKAIDETDLNWSFYRKVVSSVASSSTTMHLQQSNKP